MDRGVIYDRPALDHYLFDLPQAQRIGRLPVNARQ